jgi:3-oxoacyl-[acyl-carrier protein] reductase
VKLKDKVAIITGGGRGIGRAYSLRFADEGAKVVVADIILENAQKVADEIKAKGGEAQALHTDISSETSTTELAKKTIERFGKIDILMNNAAIYYGVGMHRWDSWAPEEWDRMFAVNVKGDWLCIKAVAPHMITQGKGKIINIASSTADSGFPGLLPYTCSKGAVITMTKVMARALGRNNINVNCISPGYTMSEASIEMPGKTPTGDEMTIQPRCFRREEQPDDLVGTAVFLASEDSDFITGQTICVDGGDVMR